MAKFLNQRFFISCDNDEVIQDFSSLKSESRAGERQFGSLLEVLAGIVGIPEVNDLVTHCNRSGLYAKTHLPIPPSGGWDGHF